MYKNGIILVADNFIITLAYLFLFHPLLEVFFKMCPKTAIINKRFFVPT